MIFISLHNIIDGIYNFYTTKIIILISSFGPCDSFETDLRIRNSIKNIGKYTLKKYIYAL